MNRRDFGTSLLAAGSAIGLVSAGNSSANAQPATGSSLEQILARKKLRVAGIVGEEPLYNKDLVTGAWSGFCIDFAKNIAEELNVELEVVETTYGSSILDLQSNKIDLSLGLTPTPKRALSTAFPPSLYSNVFSIVSKKGFSAGTWADLNKPEVTIAVDVGSSHELVARRFASKANIIAFKTRDEASLAVATGKADCFVCTILIGLLSKKKNPQLGEFSMPRPYVETLSSPVVQYDNNGRFRDFISVWVDYNRSSGRIREWIFANLGKVGLEPADIPSEVRF